VTTMFPLMCRASTMCRKVMWAWRSTRRAGVVHFGKPVAVVDVAATWCAMAARAKPAVATISDVAPTVAAVLGSSVIRDGEPFGAAPAERRINPAVRGVRV
jgi:hypothetical protein